ncbi:hypothetical protein EON68_00395 [archaeon]|nr:MAG: hypothetical protein EON68_00395 [archaeon]
MSTKADARGDEVGTTGDACAPLAELARLSQAAPHVLHDALGVFSRFGACEWPSDADLQALPDTAAQLIANVEMLTAAAEGSAHAASAAALGAGIERAASAYDESPLAARVEGLEIAVATLSSSVATLQQENRVLRDALAGVMAAIGQGTLPPSAKAALVAGGSAAAESAASGAAAAPAEGGASVLRERRTGA